MDDLFDFLLARQSGGGGGFAPPVAPKDSLLFYSSKEIGISIKNGAKNWNGTLYYSTDYTSWTEWDGTTEIVSVLYNGWHRIFLRGVSNTQITGATYGRGFVIRGSSVECKGNCNNLLNYTASPKLGTWCFLGLFGDCTSLVSAPELPATELAKYCYARMFEGCTSLVSAPELPATELARQCYISMFAYCASLTSAPELPATELAEDCYNHMFEGCTSLVSVPALPAMELAVECYFGMFEGCSNIMLSETQGGEYQNEYRVPISGEGVSASSALRGMFSNTGGSFTGTPAINTTYYTSNTVINP